MLTILGKNDQNQVLEECNQENTNNGIEKK